MTAPARPAARGGTPGPARRSVLRGAAGVAAGAALAGCSNAAQRWGFGSPGTAGRTRLTYALWDTFQQEGYQKSIDLFMSRNPGIDVVIQQIPYGNFQPKITASHISGNAPDLFWVNTPFMANWIDQGILTDITDRVKADNVDLSIYYPSLVDLHARQGQLYGLPKDWDTIAFYYNKKLMARAGAQPPAELTWDPDGGGTFLPFLRSITLDGQGRHPGESGFDAGDITQYAVGVANDPQSGYGSYFADNGGSIIKEPFSTTATMLSPQNTATLRYLLGTLREAHVLVPPDEMGPNGDGSSAQTLFAQQRIVMYQAGDWNTSAVSQLTTGFDIGVLRLPAGPKGNFSVFNGLTDGINAATEHPDEAWELAKWLGSAESQTIMGSGGYVWPAIQSLDPLFLAYWKQKNIDLRPFLAAAKDKTVNYPVSYGMAEAVTDITSALGPAFLGGTTVRPALAAADQVANYRMRAATA